MNEVLSIITAVLFLLTYRMKNKVVLKTSYKQVLKSTHRLKWMLIALVLVLIIGQTLLFLGYASWVVQLMLQVIYSYFVIIKGDILLAYGFFYRKVMGYYASSHCVPENNYDIVAQLNNGHRTEKNIDDELKTYFTLNPEDKSSIDMLFGPESLLHSNCWILKKVIMKDFKIKKYDYSTASSCRAIPNEFFLLIKMTPKTVGYILSIYNGLYSIKDCDFQLSQLIRVIGHLNEMDDLSNEMIQVIEPFLIQALKNKSKTTDKCYRRVKEMYLLKLYFRLLHLSDQKNVSTRLFKDKKYIGNTLPSDHLDILLVESNQWDDPDEALVSEIFKFYHTQGVNHDKMISHIGLHII